MSWKFWKKKKKEEIYYKGMTRTEFDKFIAGNVIGFVWIPGDFKNLNEEEVDSLCKTHKQFSFSVGVPFMEVVKCVCLYYEYNEGTSEFHMFFETPVKESLLTGNTLSSDQLIMRTKDNEHLTIQAAVQLEHNKNVEEQERQSI